MLEFERVHTPEFAVYAGGWDRQIGTVRMYDARWMAFDMTGRWIRSGKRDGMFTSRKSAGEALKTGMKPRA